MPQLRKDPITREWVIIATERSKRPSDFSRTEPIRPVAAFSPSCAFCPGNERMTPPEVIAYRPDNAPRNSPGWWVRGIPNKFPALSVEGDLRRTADGMYDSMHAVGAHEVIIESPKHDLGMGSLEPEQASEVIWALRDRMLDLEQDRRLKYLMLFKNHGKAAGASLEHAHFQLIALPMAPLDVLQVLEGASRYWDFRERCIICDMVAQELQTGARLVTANSDFIAFCPFASRHPFEVWIVPREHARRFPSISRAQASSFASLLQETLNRLAATLKDPAYNLTLHTAPVNLDRERDTHWRVAIVPRLTIAAGFEMGTGMYINVTAPEEAADHLRDATC